MAAFRASDVARVVAFATLRAHAQEHWRGRERRSPRPGKLLFEHDYQERDVVKRLNSLDLRTSTLNIESLLIAPRFRCALLVGISATFTGG